MRLICVSDTHTYGKRVLVPDGDVLLHAGDHTFKGTETEVYTALAWLESLPHKHKLFIAGNHDWFFDINRPTSFRGWNLTTNMAISEMLDCFPGITYLQDSGVEIDGLKFWGSPWQPAFYDWAFNLYGEPAAEKVWSQIPDDTNVLITHGPPHGILDRTLPGDQRAGCPVLARHLSRLSALRLHVFGHLHESYGRAEFQAEDGAKLTFVNASINTREYDPTNAPIVVDL